MIATFVIGFWFFSLGAPHFPRQFCKKRESFALILLEIQLGEGGLKVARFTNIMLNIQALVRGVVSFSTSCRPG